MTSNSPRRLSDILTQETEGGNPKKKKFPPRPSKKEISDRVAKVFDLIVEGKKRAEICEYVAEKWGVSERSAERYITRANRLFEEHAAFRREMALGKALARIDNLYSSMLVSGDHRGALQAVREEADLLGLRVLKTAATDSQGRDLTTSPQWVELRAILIQVLGRYPDAQKAVLAAISEQPENKEN